jgi:hypothetical protein
MHADSPVSTRSDASLSLGFALVVGGAKCHVGGESMCRDQQIVMAEKAWWLRKRPNSVSPILTWTQPVNRG